MRNKTPYGFTLMELLIAIAIVAILAAIAIPTYLHYTKKAYYSEVIQTADRYKASITACLLKNDGTLTACNAGSHGIPPDITTDVGQVTSVTVANSVITVTPAATHGISTTDTYILTPIYSKNGVTWSASGGGCSAGLAPNC